VHTDTLEEFLWEITLAVYVADRIDGCHEDLQM
jgi:hypothetical protein